jgi:hypothetical protein
VRVDGFYMIVTAASQLFVLSLEERELELPHLWRVKIL